MKKTILILSWYPAPYRVEVFKRLSAFYDVDVYFERDDYRDRNDKWFSKSDKSFSFYLMNDEKVKAEYENAVSDLRQYDMVLCYEPFTKGARRLQRLCMRQKVPYMINVDGADKIRTAFPYRQVKSYYIRNATACFAGSKSAEEYLKAYKATDKQIVRYPFTSLHAADIEDKPYTEEQKSSIRKSLGIRDGLMFVSVGRFIHGKGFDILLSAWEKMDEIAQIYIIGGGPLKSEYESFVAEHALKNVHILDFMPFEELRKYYLASDVFVLPTRVDVWGLVINEAMACGKPVITTKQCVAGVELVNDGENGFLYDCEDARELSDILRKMESIGNDARFIMGELSIKRIKEYCYENVISIHKKAIDLMV